MNLAGDAQDAERHQGIELARHPRCAGFNTALSRLPDQMAQILTRSELLSAFGDRDTAVLIYDTDTIPVQNAPAAELLTVRDGRIAHLRIIFDRAPFDAARRAAGTG